MQVIKINTQVPVMRRQESSRAQSTVNFTGGNVAQKARKGVGFLVILGTLLSGCAKKVDKMVKDVDPNVIFSHQIDSLTNRAKHLIDSFAFDNAIVKMDANVKLLENLESYVELENKSLKEIENINESVIITNDSVKAQMIEKIATQLHDSAAVVEKNAINIQKAKESKLAENRNKATEMTAEVIGKMQALVDAKK